MNNTFARRLRDLRKESNITQIEFARKFNIANGTVGNWESGNRQPDYETLQKIADFFNVSVDYLLDDSLDSEQVSCARRTVKRLLEEQNRLIVETEESLGVSYVTLRSWCNGYGDYFNEVTRLSKVADFLNVSVGYLLGEEEQEAKKEKSTEYDGLSEKRKALIDFALSVPEEKAEKILQVMKLIVEGE